MCLGTIIWSLTHTESKPKASTCCASRRMFCMVATCPRLGRLKPNSIRPLLVTRYGPEMAAVVADLLDQSKSCGSLVALKKVGYTAGTHTGFLRSYRENTALDPDQAIRELGAIVGASNVLSSRAERTVYGYDASVFRGTELLAVVLPEMAQQIARLVTWCQRHQVPYLARGTGTGISGAAIPTHGGLVIEMARMNRVLEIDLENGVAVVEPG